MLLLVFDCNLVTFPSYNESHNTPDMGSGGRGQRGLKRDFCLQSSTPDIFGAGLQENRFTANKPIGQCTVGAKREEVRPG